jgi:chromosome segregation ATPase
VTPVQSASPTINEHEQELQQLRQNIASLTNQCTQLDEANRAWQLYQQTQLDNFTNTIHNYLPIDQTSSLDQVAQQIVNHISNEREDFTQRYHSLEKVNNDLQSSKIYINDLICLCLFLHILRFNK